VLPAAQDRSRALSGKLLSKATLTLFVDAFGFDAFERERLLKLWEGSAHVRVLSPTAIREDQANALGPPQRSRRWPCTIITISARTGCRQRTGHPRHRSGRRRRDRLPVPGRHNALTIEVGRDSAA